MTRLERVIGALLAYGTAAATAGIALGLGIRRPAVVTAAIALLIALPVARVATMAVAFGWRRDYRLTAVAITVLAILGTSFVIAAR